MRHPPKGPYEETLEIMRDISNMLSSMIVYRDDHRCPVCQKRIPLLMTACGEHWPRMRGISGGSTR